MALTFTLGSWTLQDFEIPEEISLGGKHKVAVHELVGGRRVLDMLGRQDAPVAWSGRFRGPDAADRALAVDQMRIAGRALTLSVGPFLKNVVIEDFPFNPQQMWEIPYTISCIVQADLAQPNAPGQGPDVDDMMSTDMANANGLASDIDDDSLTGMVATLSDAVASVPSFAGAPQGVLNSVLGPLSVVQGRVGALITAAYTAVDPTVSLGGVITGAPAGLSASALLGQVASMAELPSLYDLQSITGRMATNLLSVRASGSQVVTAGGDLYRMASKAYGSAAEWPTIALANGLSDPVLSGINTILVPPSAGGNDGILES